jgi:hypothetical protein
LDLPLIPAPIYSLFVLQSFQVPEIISRGGILVAKRVMVGTLTMIMVLMLASCTFAVTTFSLNTLLDGKSENGGYNYDLSQWTLGLNVPLNKKLTLSADLLNGEIERNGATGDTSGYKLKGAYQVFSDSKVCLALTGGLYRRDLELPYYADYTVSSLTFGVDGQLKLDQKAWLHFGLALGLLSDEKLDEYYGSYYKGDPSSLVLFNLKLNYLINKQFGLSLGYVSESYDSDLLIRGNSHTGLNGGAFFRF